MPIGQTDRQRDGQMNGCQTAGYITLSARSGHSNDTDIGLLTAAAPAAS